MDFEKLPARLRDHPLRSAARPRRSLILGAFLLTASILVLVAIHISRLPPPNPTPATTRTEHEAAAPAPDVPSETRTPSPIPRPRETVVETGPIPDRVPPRPDPQPVARSDRPGNRPVPDRVNDFLQEEHARNAVRCEIIADDYHVDVAPAYAVRLLEPQWDDRSASFADDAVVWFYVYESAGWQGATLSVFGVVDTEGRPLFQHPGLAGDPLALLEGRYDAFEWITLRQPSISLIAGLVQPTGVSGAVMDLFLVNGNADGPKTWRFAEKRSPEEPTATGELCAFVDATGDGLKDLCSLLFERDGGERRPRAGVRPYRPDLGSFVSDPESVDDQTLELLKTLFDEKAANRSVSPQTLWRPGFLTSAAASN